MTHTELRATLARLRLRQVALARALGVHRVTVARWVGGKVAVPPYVPSWLALHQRAQAGNVLGEQPERRFSVDGTVA